jgi:hypothetical protein
MEGMGKAKKSRSIRERPRLVESGKDIVVSDGAGFSKNTRFPSSIPVKVASLDYGPQTKGFGRVFHLLFGVRRQFVLTIGRGDRAHELGTFVFDLPPDFGSLSHLEQARVLVREYRRVKREERAALGIPQEPDSGFYRGLDEEKLLTADDVSCEEGEW